MSNLNQNKSTINPSDVAKYFLYRSMQDGELVSPLKMQKLVYYAYALILAKKGKKLFDEKIEAWANGPVVPTLYQELKRYGSSPINEDYLGFSSEEDVAEFMQKFPEEVLDSLDKVYSEYMTKTAFELVVLTHSEKPWVEARKGLKNTEASSNPISDELIVEQYG